MKTKATFIFRAKVRLYKIINCTFYFFQLLEKLRLNHSAGTDRPEPFTLYKNHYHTNINFMLIHLDSDNQFSEILLHSTRTVKNEGFGWVRSKEFVHSKIKMFSIHYFFFLILTRTNKSQKICSVHDLCECNWLINISSIYFFFSKKHWVQNRPISKRQSLKLKPLGSN